MPDTYNLVALVALFPFITRLTYTHTPARTLDALYMQEVLQVLQTTTNGDF